jgi:molybdate transport system substrate-binding protein
MRTRAAAIAASAVASLALAACTSPAGQHEPGTGGSTPQGSITVFAAASLREVFTTLGDAYMSTHPNTEITFSFGPSSGLATQIVDGAPADVFASASTKTMDTVVQAGLASTSTRFARNSMAIATPTSATVPVTSLEDLAKPGVKVAVCAADVPCGTAADKLFSANQLAVTPVTREVDVKSVLSKVQLGEVDAGIVYVTDVKAAGDAVVGIDIPAGQNVTTDYPIAVLKHGAENSVADSFVSYVLATDNLQVLLDAGFTAP